MSRLSKRQKTRGIKMQELAFTSLKVEGSGAALAEWVKNLTPAQIKMMTEMYKELPDKESDSFQGYIE